MDLRTQKKWFYILLLTMACTLSLALDSSRRRELCYNIDKRQASSHQNREYERVCSLSRLLNQHKELVTTDPSTKNLKIMIGSSLLSKIMFNTTNTLISQNDNNGNEDTGFDDGLFLSSATNGKDKKNPSQLYNVTNNEDDEKKTLSQQVKEGKYGLIQNEIYPVKPERPGIISYLSNSEVPRDTVKNLGGLDKEEIWLAENHVLVLKGGSFPGINTAVEQSETEWPPIDNYVAPQRPVKIPTSPKVPPPFPVQLNEDGPVQLIGNNGSNLLNNDTIDFNVLSGSFRGFLPGEGPYFPLPMNKSNSNIIAGTFGLPKKKTKAEDITVPFYPSLPPGAVIVSPPSNQVDYDDEDQSVYYPPPYSFIYSRDNSTDIPPGPLVPGIILPPPPNFFSSVDENKSITKDKNANNMHTTVIPSLRISYVSRPKSSTKSYKTSLPTVSTIETKTHRTKPFIRTKMKNSTFQQHQKEKITTSDYRIMPFVEQTTPTSIKSIKLESPENYNVPQIVAKQITETNTEKPPWKNKALPFKTYFATTIPVPIEQTVEATPASIKSILITDNPTRFSNYYFYEESNEATRSSTFSPFVFFDTTTQKLPYYKFDQSKQHQQKNRKEYYNAEKIPTQETTKDFNVKFIESFSKNPHVHSILDLHKKNSQEKCEIPSIKKQSLRVLQSKSMYYQPLSSRTAPKLSYFSTQNPKTYFMKPRVIENFEYESSSSKSKPIYQYSFEATNYEKSNEHSLPQKLLISKQEQKQQIDNQQIPEYRRQKDLTLYTEYQDIESIEDQYGFKDSEVTVKQPIQIQKTSYMKNQMNYHQSTTDTPRHFTTLASHQQYFTKQEEQLLDDVTKEYFTVFGKKLSNNKVSSTTPIYSKKSVTDRPIFNKQDYESRQYNGREANTFRASNIEVRYGDQTPGPLISKDNIYVNYKHSEELPTVDPNSDLISLLNISPPSNEITTKFRTQPVLKLSNQFREYVQNVKEHFDKIQNYENDRLEQQLQNPQGHAINSFAAINNQRDGVRETGYSKRPVPLESDISVNYKNPRPSIDLDAEFIDKGLQNHGNTNNKANSYFAYRLPGDGGHFYFLTPRAISGEHSTGQYLYSKPRASRLLEKRRR